MSEHPHAEIRRLFDLAIEAPSSDRERLLDRECGADAPLKDRVLAMVAAAEAGDFLSRPTGDGPAADATIVAPSHERPGQMIGRYKLLELLGEGGFGSVWMAEQREPVKRRVAVKVIKLGMDTRQVIARFEAERQALALMDHPNIARVLDAGATEAGRPYFVMEYIKGVPIVGYCDTEKLDTGARLELFTRVCHAIQHAHQKGIIHRDIKPSNVLITLHDGVPVPKVIDFGIAKATNRELTDKTLFTEHRQIIGTPAYMSPEQAEMSGLDIDTRSDIYSLGVLLYELLTGTTPFATEELMSKGFAEMMRIIREVEPHKPSTRLSSLGDSATRTAQQRHTDAKKLGLILRGDLDWIVMKCLEKDRQRRYETANGLAADIARHLADEPVDAGPPSAGYKLRKFVRRNRGQVVGASVVAAILVLASGISVAFGVLATQARDAMNEARTDLREALDSEREARTTAEANEQKAVEEAERAERELARATEIKRLITEMLQSVSPEEAQGADITLLRGILDDAAERLAAGEIADELIAAELHHVVGNVYLSLGLYPEAEEHIPVAAEIRRRILGEEHPDTLATMPNVATLYLDQGRFADAEAMHSQTLEVQRRVLGGEHPDTLASMNNLVNLYKAQGRYAEAEPLALETLEIKRRVLGQEHPETLASMNNLATLYLDQGRYAEAQPLFQQTLEAMRRVLGEKHPNTLMSVHNLALLYGRQGRYADAEPLALETLEITRRVLGEEHPDTLASMNYLALLYRVQGRYAEAEPLLAQALEFQRRVLGQEHPHTLVSMGNLALLYRDQRRYAEAEPLHARVLELHRRVLGEEHVSTLGSITNLGNLYNSMGRYEDAAGMFEQSLPIKRRVLGMQHPYTAIAMRGLATAYDHLDRHDEALPLWSELLNLQLARAESPEADASTLNAAAWTLLTHDIEQLRDPRRALAYAERACAMEEAADGANLWACLDTLALAQHATGDTAAAIATQRRAIALMPTPDADQEMHDRLAEYEAALQATSG
ncbi:MAG: tetratricopeptide repeat protein [Phycisphaerales bacterium]